jgi:hypothetical protein
MKDGFTGFIIIYGYLFVKVFRPFAKQRIASKTIKRYDNPKTPYQRVMDSPDIGPSIKKKLTTLFKTLNPFHLRKAMEDKLKKIFLLCYKNSR